MAFSLPLKLTEIENCIRHIWYFDAFVPTPSYYVSLHHCNSIVSNHSLTVLSTSPHPISSHLILSRLISSYPISCQFILLQHMLSSNFKLSYPIPLKLFSPSLPSYPFPSYLIRCLRFDCVYPTRVARFGVALVPSGTMRLKAKEYSRDLQPVGGWHVLYIRVQTAYVLEIYRNWCNCVYLNLHFPMLLSACRSPLHFSLFPSLYFTFTVAHSIFYVVFFLVSCHSPSPPSSSYSSSVFISSPFLCYVSKYPLLYSSDLLTLITLHATIEVGCLCSTCRSYTRAFLHTAFKDNNALAAQLLTKHNIAHMMALMRSMRKVSQSPNSCSSRHDNRWHCVMWRDVVSSHSPPHSMSIFIPLFYTVFRTRMLLHIFNAQY